MIIGLNQKQNLELANHNSEWEKIAAQTIERLWRVFNSIRKSQYIVGKGSGESESRQDESSEETTRLPVGKYMHITRRIGV